MDIIGQALQNLGFDWRVAIANLVNFLIVFWLLKRFLWKPIQEKLDDRRRIIEEGVEKAQVAKEAEQRAEEEYLQRIQKAKEEGSEIVKEARQEEQRIVEGARIKAEETAGRVLQDAEGRAETLVNDARDGFTKEAAALVIAGVEKLLREEVDQKRGEEIIRSLTAE